MADKHDKEQEQKHEASGNKMALDDARRVKSLSPGMLVFKRFVRNRLAIAGAIIIVFMFIFAFLGPVFTSYAEEEPFYKQTVEDAQYAEAKINNDYLVTVKDGMEFSQSDLTAFNGIVVKNAETFESKDRIFSVEVISAGKSYNIKLQKHIAAYINVDDEITINFDEGENAPDSGFVSEAKKVLAGKATKFEYNGQTYIINRSKTNQSIYKLEDTAVITKNYFTSYTRGDVVSYEEKYAALVADAQQKTEFTVGETAYRMTYEAVGSLDYITLEKQIGGEYVKYAEITTLFVNPVATNVYLSIDYCHMLRETAAPLNSGNIKGTFVFKNADGEDITYSVERKDIQYVIRTETVKTLVDTNASPNSEHLLGTDKNGMDIFVRLMYGGRISLTVGFIVILIETFLGVIMGGISGYFSGWIDTLIMRIVDVMNCIPTLPLYIILGTALEQIQITETQRLFLLMAVLGVTGWPGIARVVRGQILSLREQDFMLAAEATGLSTSRRIFKHLVPNVIPQLIVYATMGLGSVILTEATLSYLNLSVKYPSASWGNMINTVTDGYTMVNYWFAWIPAGLLILLTVLGFNFIGDGLRDAFDPKMKR